MLKLRKLKNQIINSQLAKDSFWAIFGNVIGKALSLLSVVIIARILGKDLYGEYGFLINTMISIAIFSTFGLGYTSTKYIAENIKNNPGLLYTIIGITQKTTFTVSVITTSIIFLFSDFFAIHVFENPSSVKLIQFSSFYIIFNSIVRTQIGILSGFRDFKGIAINNSIIGVLAVLTTFLAYYYGLKGALLGALLIQIINFILNRILIKKNLKIYQNVLNDKSNFMFKTILAFSFPVALQEALYSSITWLYGLLLVKFSNYGEVGLNAAAVYWSALILFIPGILRNVVLSHMSSSLNDNSQHNRVLRVILIFNLSITFTLSIAVYLFSDIITSFYGDNFIGLRNVLNISVFTTIFASLSNVYAQAYMSKSKNWLMLMFRIIRDGATLVIAYILITNENGLNGALSLAQSSFISNIFFLILMAGFYEFKLKNRITLV